MVGSIGLGRVFGSLVACLALACSTQGVAQAAEGEFMRDAMSGIGLIEPERPAITYNERAPLVMPPSLGAKSQKPHERPHERPHGRKSGRDGTREADRPLDTAVPILLPPPQTRQTDPQWPKDPEITRRERAAVDALRPVVHGARGRENDNNMTLPVDELERGRRAGAGLSNAPAGAPGETRESTWIDTLSLFGGGREAPSLAEPARDGLTDPPTGYRKAPVRVERRQDGPVGGSISGNEEADPRAYLRSQGGR